MNWVKNRVRVWLGIDADLRTFAETIQEQNETIRVMNDTIDILVAIKPARLAPVRRVPVYPDYESSQVEALKDFMES